MNCQDRVFPSWNRRGGCASKKKTRSLRSGADGVVIMVNVDVVTLSGTDQRVRRWPSRRLPFVAAGVDSPDLPACIFHAPGDPAVIAPEEGRYRYFLSWPLNTKAFQSNKAESIEDFVLELQMVTTAFRLGFHAAEPRQRYPAKRRSVDQSLMPCTVAAVYDRRRCRKAVELSALIERRYSSVVLISVRRLSFAAALALLA